MSTPASPPAHARPCAEPSEPGVWFKDEVHAHDRSLRSYLRNTFPSVRDVDDVVQESYLRVWRARLSRQVLSAKSFLFQTARNLAVDLIRRRDALPTESMEDSPSLPVLQEKRDVADQLAFDEQVGLLSEAFLSLPPRCREIMILRKLKGLSTRETADQLGISVPTVENQVVQGVRRCREHLEKRGIRSFRE